MSKGLALFLVFFFAITGCYTVIKHPGVEDAEHSQYNRQVYFSDNCMDCHQNDPGVAVPVNHPYLPRLNYIQKSERWNYFYQNPWWYRDIFYSTSPGGGNNNSGSSSNLPTTSARSRFPGTGNRASANTSTRITGGSNSGSTTAGTGTTSGTNQQGDVREKSGKSTAREAIRGTGDSKKNNTKPKKVERRKKK